MEKPSISVTTDGPYAVTGDVTVVRRRIVRDDEGYAVGWEDDTEYDLGDRRADDGRVYLCRCGHSGDKPFCDGSHARIGFDGTETASTLPYDELARLRTEQGTTLGDAAYLCAHTGFCLDSGGDVWDRMRRRRTEHTQAQLEGMVEMCPSGRLRHRPADADEWVEPDLPHQVVVAADAQLHVTGGIPVERADGQPCETRNRVSLCRCGRSNTKPYCDGTHAEIGFSDEPGIRTGSPEAHALHEEGPGDPSA